MKKNLSLYFLLFKKDLRVTKIFEQKYGKKWAKRKELLTSPATNANSTVAEEDAPKNFNHKYDLRNSDLS